MKLDLGDYISDDLNPWFVETINPSSAVWNGLSIGMAQYMTALMVALTERAGS